MTTETITTTAVEVAEHLQLLLVERALAEVEGLGDNATYMADLDEEIAATRDAYWRCGHRDRHAARPAVGPAARVTLQSLHDDHPSQGETACST